MSFCALSMSPTRKNVYKSKLKFIILYVTEPRAAEAMAKANKRGDIVSKDLNFYLYRAAFCQ